MSAREDGDGAGMESLRSALDRLAAAGYDAEFFVRDGALHCAGCDGSIAPEDVVIEDLVRFEGESDPDEEMVVYAISSGPCGRKGTYAVGFGPAIDRSDQEVVLRLRDARRRS
jgi:hypothetical protein